MSGVSLRNYKLWILVIVAVAATRAAIFYNNLNQPATPSVPTESFIVTAGESFGRVADRLEADELIPSAFDLKLYARFTGVAENIRAGEFPLEAGMNALSIVELLVNGQEMYHNITLPEGWTIREAVQAIREHPVIVPVMPDASDESIRQVLGISTSPEGLLFPDTYLITRGTTDEELLRRAHTMLVDVLEEEWQLRDVGLPYNDSYEALIMASIIEKETAAAEERPEIAGVFVRRLNQGMRLQTDPTVIYGLGDTFDGNLTRAHLRQGTPWNTYVINGLPPTPIALVGREAIQASLHPSQGSSLYFVARGDGTHVFSATLEEHNAAVRTWQIERRGTAATTEDKPQ